jgi:hypothetical protein
MRPRGRRGQLWYRLVAPPRHRPRGQPHGTHATPMAAPRVTSDPFHPSWCPAGHDNCCASNRGRVESGCARCVCLQRKNVPHRRVDDASLSCNPSAMGSWEPAALDTSGMGRTQHRVSGPMDARGSHRHHSGRGGACGARGVFLLAAAAVLATKTRCRSHMSPMTIHGDDQARSHRLMWLLCSLPLGRCLEGVCKLQVFGDVPQCRQDFLPHQRQAPHAILVADGAVVGPHAEDPRPHRR